MPQSRIILVFIVIIGLAAGYFYYFDIIGEPEAPPPIPVTEGRDAIESFSDLTLDFSILDNEIYKSLQPFGESPISPNVTGKNNIFAPF